MKLAHGEWILTIDADEILNKNSIARFREHVSNTNLDAVRLCVKSGTSEWLVTRLFRRKLTHRYYGRVHEWVSVEGNIVDDWKISIRNRPNKRGKESSVQRDLRLCSLSLAEFPDDSRMVFYLARALRRSNLFAESIRQYQTYLELEKSFTAGRYAATYGIALCHFLAGNWQKAIVCGRQAIALEHRLAECHCLVADSYFALGKMNSAVRWYQKALACGPPPDDYPFFIDRSFYSQYPRQRLAFFEITVATDQNKRR